MMKLFCRHEYERIGEHKIVSEYLYKCKKCDGLLIQHWGIAVNCKVKLTDIKWEDWTLKGASK